jgi:hypothetical protein
MSTLSGFVVGFVLGAKHGPEGLARLREAWRAVLETKEVQGVLGTAAPELAALADGGGERLLAAAKQIAASEEMRELVSGGVALARQLFDRGLEAIGEQLGRRGHLPGA